ncbi:MAG TPA: hypothetical protein VK067_04640 [Pseudogracilibacillus sp.]|nr:hypothetical protein [Pseudogracilibacillus sp.]
MIMIQTLADVHSLKDDECLPSFYIKEIYHQFIGSYESMANDEEIDSFSLPSYACIYHFNDVNDWQMLQGLLENIEYVDTEIVDEVKYFRIGIMQDYEMSVIYFLEGTLPYKTEKWLEN